MSYLPHSPVKSDQEEFGGSNIARQIATAPKVNDITRRVQLSSRNPHRLHAKLEKEVPSHSLSPPIAVDVTKPNTLAPAFEGAKVIVSLVGLMHGSPQQFDAIQWHGAENVAYAAKQVGAKLVHFSAIGADAGSHIPYARTKRLAEKSVLEICPNATIIRPSLVFGPEDDFFNVNQLHFRFVTYAYPFDRGLRSLPDFCLSYRCMVGELHDFNRCTLATWPAQLKSFRGWMRRLRNRFLER